MSSVAGSAASVMPADLSTVGRQPVADVLERLGVTADGLTTSEAAAQRARFGENVVATHRVTALGVLIRQLRNPLLILLLGAAAISAATGDPTDGAIIAAIVVLSVGLGFVNEYRSEVAVAALNANIRHDALVRRDGREQRVDVRDLVPGDIVTLAVGDLVPADVRLLQANQLECDEGVLTGESMPAAKSAVPASTDSVVDLPSCAFMGTVVHQGSAQAVVVATGAATAFGKIAVGLSERQTETAFQAGLRDFSTFLVRIAAVLTISIFVINVALSRPLLEALLFSLAIAIGITPQLLPAIVSVSLSTGSRELARRRVLVKRLVDDRGPRQHRGAVHGQDGNPHRRRHHLRPDPGRSRTARRGHAAVRVVVQRGGHDGGRPGRRQRPRCRTLVGAGGQPAPCLDRRSVGILTSRVAPVRARAPARFRSRARCPRRRPVGHERGTRGGHSPVRRHAGDRACHAPATLRGWRPGRGRCIAARPRGRQGGSR